MRITTAQEKLNTIDDGKKIKTIDDNILRKVKIGDEEVEIYIKYNSNLKDMREDLGNDLMENR